MLVQRRFGRPVNGPVDRREGRIQVVDGKCPLARNPFGHWIYAKTMTVLEPVVILEVWGRKRPIPSCLVVSSLRDFRFSGGSESACVYLPARAEHARAIVSISCGMQVD